MNRIGRLSAAHAFSAEFPFDGRRIRFWCDLRNALAREVFFLGSYEPQETLLLPALLRPGDTCVDVGAHWGYFSLLAAARVGSTGRVVAVEADPRVFATLERTLALNPELRVEALWAAAAAERGTLVLNGFDEQGDNWGISSLATPQGGERFEVCAEPLDAILDRYALSEVRLLKMDIEGAEALALKGAEQSFRERRIRTVLLELHPLQIAALGTSVENLLARLRGFGYHLWSVDHSLKASRATAYGRLTEPRALLKPLEGDHLDSWPHVLACRERNALA
jgi:FkbM family methyltransferase